MSTLKLFLIAAIITQNVHGEEKKPIGAVVTNGPACAKIGTSILEKKGSAVDAAIAALFCEGVYVPNCMGLGGGFFMNIYINETKQSDFLVAREVAPKNASKDMFGSNETLATRGGLAVAVPGELKGYWEAHEKYGKLPWKDLVQPTIDLLKEGIAVTEYLENVYKSYEEVIKNDKGLSETFINITTSHPYVKNEYMKRSRLAKTLELIAESGVDVLYNGTLTKDFVQDIQDHGGIITEEDLANYKPKWKDTIKIDLPFNQTLYAPPLPGSGVILGLIISTLKDILDFSNPLSTTNWQKIIESFKFGFAKRTELGDPDFVDMTEIIATLTSQALVEEIRQNIFDNQTFNDPAYYGANVTQPDDHGTANVCVFAPNGDAVSVTSTINLDFGAGFMSESTGIILNDQMDDFSSPDFTNNYGVPPSPNNFIEEGKRPMSSMNPSIVVDSDGSVRLVVGGSGGTKIITSIALTIIRNLWFNETISDVVSDKRLHHQLFPMQVLYEKGFPQEILDALTKLGHNCTVEPSDGFNTVTSIAKENGILHGSFDRRRGGGEEYVYYSGALSWTKNCLICHVLVFILNILFTQL